MIDQITQKVETALKVEPAQEAVGVDRIPVKKKLV